MLTPDQWLAVVSVLAVIISPIFALEVQKRLDDRRASLDRKMTIFRRLMNTRATQMSPVHVEALNGIEVEFYATSGPDKKVLDAWRQYVSHLYKPTGDGDALGRWVETKNGLLIELLYQMAQRLKYDIDKVAIEKNVYHPKGYIEIESEQHALRKAALAVLSGEQAVQATIVGRVQTTQPLGLPAELGVAQPALGPPALARPAPPIVQAEAILERPEE